MQNFNVMGRIKVSQIKILKILKSILELTLQKFFPTFFRKPNPSPIINGPHSRRDEFCLLSSSRLVTHLLTLLLLSRPLLPFQRFPYMHSFGYVTQILTLIEEISPHLLKEPVTIILSLIVDQFIISFFYFILS